LTKIFLRLNYNEKLADSANYRPTHLEMKSQI
jgi:hypothetical protein